MKKRFQWFTLYPGHPKASNLSILSGGVKLVSLLLLIGAALASLAVLAVGVRLALVGGLGTALSFLLGELDEELFLAFFLWCAVAVCRYLAAVLSAKAALLAGESAPAQEAASSQGPSAQAVPSQESAQV